MKSSTIAFKISCVLLIISCLFSCKKKNSIKHEDSCVISTQQKIIVIQPYSDLDKSQVDYLVDEIKKVCPKVAVNKPIPLPSSAYYLANKRFRADSIIAIQKRICQNKYTLLGLTSKDISTTKGNAKDFGIMGLGYCPGYSCVVSSFRLRGNNRMEKFRKVTLHELAHTEGLPHCPNLHCYMRDAKGKDHLNEETDFCEGCKKKLLEKGWKL